MVGFIRSEVGGLLLEQGSTLHTLVPWSPPSEGASLCPGRNTGVCCGFVSEQVTPVRCSLNQERVSSSL